MGREAESDQHLCISHNNREKYWRTGERVVKKLLMDLSVLCQKKQGGETRVLCIKYSLFKYRQPFCWKASLTAQQL